MLRACIGETRTLLKPKCVLGALNGEHSYVGVTECVKGLKPAVSPLFCGGSGSTTTCVNSLFIYT